MANLPGERTFIHDLASPVNAALFLLEMVTEDMEARTPPPTELLQVRQAYEALLKIQTLLTDRRTLLIEHGTLSDKPR